MTADVVLGVVERVGVPAALLLAGVAVIWRLSGVLLAALLASHEARLAEVRADRDWFRDRYGAGDQLICRLAEAVLDDAERPPEGWRGSAVRGVERRDGGDDE